MEAWRLVKTARLGEALSGEGARLYGGRWNPRGLPAVYLADSLSLAQLELLVHLGPEERGEEFSALRLELPRAPFSSRGVADLPKDWRHSPAPAACQELGGVWLREGRELGLWLPSVLVPVQRNLLLNPKHPAMARVRVQETLPITLDPRLLG